MYCVCSIYVANNRLLWHCIIMHVTRVALFVALLVAQGTVFIIGISGMEVCEQIDGDCPKCTHSLVGGLNPVAEVHLSGEVDLVASAQSAESYLKDLSPSHIQQFDNPKTGLHTSLFYFCCHPISEVFRIKEAFRVMRWLSFEITYDTFGCNNDHDGKTVYLHALPTKQSDLFSWAKVVENTMHQWNISVNHPRKSLFHMTLARVDPDYPIDTAVAHLNRTRFGTHRLCSFVFEDETFTASDCE